MKKIINIEYICFSLKQFKLGDAFIYVCRLLFQRFTYTIFQIKITMDHILLSERPYAKY